MQKLQQSYSQKYQGCYLGHGLFLTIHKCYVIHTCASSFCVKICTWCTKLKHRTCSQIQSQMVVYTPNFSLTNFYIFNSVLGFCVLFNIYITPLADHYARVGEFNFKWVVQYIDFDSKCPCFLTTAHILHGNVISCDRVPEI